MQINIPDQIPKDNARLSASYQVSSFFIIVAHQSFTFTIMFISFVFSRITDPIEKTNELMRKILKKNQFISIAKHQFQLRKMCEFQNLQRNKHFYNYSSIHQKDIKIHC